MRTAKEANQNQLFASEEKIQRVNANSTGSILQTEPSQTDNEYKLIPQRVDDGIKSGLKKSLLLMRTSYLTPKMNIVTLLTPF